MAENFAKSRFLLASAEYGANEKEVSALQAIADGIRCRIVNEGNNIELSIDFDDADAGNYLEIVEEGMPAPLAGGSGGIAHNPDGSTYRSQYPPQLWGTPLENLAKTGSDTQSEIKRMLQDLFIQEVQSIVQESKNDIARIAKKHITQSLNSIISK